ncbi:hypothetical protein MPDQ_004279 [Monascus purpureus]|uniref:Linalool dehydratase/isomerase domain-containing protein n=1 Tax=Monascus purpureus TaxID=5098 RepID=A0A507QM06_MONPU|nr:hypothetical protein MPDQ_004279 [Monascus purpureus]
MPVLADADTLLTFRTTDYDPIVKDNIMLTGFFLLTTALFGSATLDDTFSKDGSLDLVIDKRHHYPNSSKTLANALVKNYKKSEYCFYACEPNWIHTACNIYGGNALAAYDAVIGSDNFGELETRYRKALIEELSVGVPLSSPVSSVHYMPRIDGAALTIKSHLTGFTIPSLAGATNEFFPAAFSGSIMPDVALRSYAIAREEYMHFDEKGKLSFTALEGADKLDPGTYKIPMGSEVASAVREILDKDESIGHRKEEDGVIYYSKVSLMLKSLLLLARLMKKGLWKRAIREPLPDTIKYGPYLRDAKYPEMEPAVENAECVLRLRFVNTSSSELRKGREVLFSKDTVIYHLNLLRRER